MRIEIPELSLVAMIGATASGKTTFAKKFFKPTEILSSDFFRGLVSDDENDQTVTAEAFELLYKAAEKRLALGKLTVIDATNVQKNARRKITELAKEQNVHAVAIVLDIPLKTLLERNAAREEKQFREGVVHRHYSELRESVKKLRKEGFRYVYILSLEDIGNAEIVRTKLWNDRRDEHGPFDIIGDIHGCCDELTELLCRLGYTEDSEGSYVHPEGRKAVFLGDLCDRGPQNVNVLKTVMSMVKAGSAIAVPGNHDAKLVKYLKGKQIQITNGIDKTIAELENKTTDFRSDVCDFLDGLISHYVLDDGKLVVAHAGIKQEFIGRSSARVRDFCLYGETDGETDETGLPVRMNWAADYRGKAAVIYGHTPVGSVRPANNTYCIDTGCVFGGRLTALRYPEMETVSVAAKEQYCKPLKPIDSELPSCGDILSTDGLLGKMHIETALIPSVTIHEENSAAALEAMSRFAADPHWLIYLPPTMSPCETSSLDRYLEYPSEAFEYYRKNGVREVICEKKHMGSRAVIVLCRSAEAAKNRFGVTDGSRGIIYTRTGRHFFEDSEIEAALLERLDARLTANGFWEDFHTDWVCLDTELMPWSEKALGLIKEQYAAVGHAAQNSLEAATKMLEKVWARDSKVTSPHSVDMEGVMLNFFAKREAAKCYIKAYGEYCRTVKCIDDYSIAPFHILACEGQNFSDKPHEWHIETINKYITDGKIFISTPYIRVDTEDENSVAEGVNWWKKVTGTGGEGMVVKPNSFIAHKGQRLLQPAVKCRGQEYLRIIYGMEYTKNKNLRRLKKRSLLRKRALALKEFSLGMESLSRFVKNEPLYRVHECVFGVLALESEPVDPRL